MDLLTPAEVAAILKVHRRTVISWLQKKQIPGFKLGENAAGQWRTDRRDLDRYLLDHKLNKGGGQ
ncbi:MAG: helix-turn-helix domain-containing protein [Negativicutes bacterium]|nr:helix-turn-helix domain-containing protein [Negativicutes bacterium]